MKNYHIIEDKIKKNVFFVDFGVVYLGVLGAGPPELSQGVPPAP